MDLEFGPKYQQLRSEVRAFLKQYGHLSPGVEPIRRRPSQQVLDWQQMLVERGYAARTIPQQYGGFGSDPDPLALAIIQEEFASQGAFMGLSGQGVSMLVPTLLEHGRPDQKDRLIGPTIRGEIIWCQGYSEPGSGSDLASLRTYAVEDGDDFLVNGQKIWTSGAHYSDMMFALVRTEPEAPKHRGISYLLLSMDSPGIEVRPLQTMTLRAEFNEVFFTDVRVPQRQVVGARGEGWKVANTTLKYERGLLGDPNELMSRLHEVIEMMLRPRADGNIPMRDALLRDRLLQLQGRVFAQRHHGLRMLSDEINGQHSGMAELVTKLVGSAIKYDLATLALDLQGEYAALFEEGEHLYQEGSWQARQMHDLGLIIGGGTAQIQKNIISERGLGMPRELRPGKPG